MARALYNNPEVLVLDEATSALDMKTERDLMENLLKNREDLTIVSIAHRISSLDNFDRNFEVKNGKLTSLTTL